jgi:hypothetical protein
MKKKDKSLQDGLDALDRDRAASLADEGGGAAAVVEGGDEEVSMRRRTSKPRRNPPAPPHSEGEDVDDTTPTPARPLPAITPAVDDRHA